MNRWSYCSSDEDEKDEEKDKGEKPKEQIAENVDIEKFKNQTGDILVAEKVEVNDENNKKPTAENGDDEEEDPYEWEYFYEDVDLPNNNEKDAKTKPEGTKSPIPKRLEGLAKPSTNNQIKVGHVINEGATKITKEKPTSLTAPSPQAGPSGKTQRVNPKDGWECPTCTLLNEPKRPGCEACTTERPADYVIPPPGAADTIPRNTTIQPIAINANANNTAKDAPTLKVVAATVTKAEQPNKVNGAVGGKVLL